MATQSSACTAVGKGGVGESGASSMVLHKVSNGTAKMIVLRRTVSSLCPNTGAVAVLAVNGTPAAFGNITAAGASLQTEANPGDTVTAVVHTVPLLNDIVCVRLGELEYKLDECELVRASGAESSDAALAATTCIATRDWYAWNNLMPPRPDDFHVVGEVQVSNPGVDIFLVPKIPQGINPTILLLDLVLVQRPGNWPQVIMWKPARYDKNNVTYAQVQVFHGGCVVADLKVDNVQ